MKLNHQKAIIFSGIVWLLIGFLLLYKGLFLFNDQLKAHSPVLTGSIIYAIKPYTGSIEQAALVAISIALFIGLLKGRIVLKKTVQRVVGHIRSQGEPVLLKNVYKPGYFILIAGMMILGMTIKFLPIAWDTRGFVDVAIGSALLNGAMLYFRSAIQVQTEFRSDDRS